MSGDIEQLRSALRVIRKAAGSGRDFTNRMQFIHARAGAALDGIRWDEDWKAEYGYAVRERALIENDKLRAFAQAVMESWPFGDVDGAALQDMAIEHGLLEPRTVTEPCGESCQCAEHHGLADMSVGVECYWRTPLLTGRAHP